MGRYFYTARDSDGKKISGVEDASSQEEVISRVQAMNLIVVDIAADSDVKVKGLREDVVEKSKVRTRHYRVTGDDLVLYCRQLATLLGAGVTILRSLEIIAMQVNSFKLFTVIRDLQKNMEAGLSLHEAMAKHPTIFSEMWVNLVESGEASGNLAIVLSRLATYLEKTAAFRNKIISAIIYPIILMVAGLAALLFLTIKIVPTFAELFAGFDLELPLLTQILISVSSFLRKYFILLVILIGVGTVLFRKYVRTNEGRKKLENMQFKLPVFGELFKAMVAERFSSEMSTLVESGVPILYSLEITEHSVGNLVVADIIRKMKEDVRDGKPLNQPLAKSGFFDPMFVQMVTIGEEIGELSPMFKKINAFYQEYVETFLTRFASMFEPFMLIFIGGIIGILVIGMFLPIFQIAQISG